MSYFIAVTGKGGVGKTTIAGFLVLRLIHHGCLPVLAVDADPNTCLDVALGVKVQKTIGRVREEAREISSQQMASGITKSRLLETKISESIVETSNFDLIAMGRPEGPGCYCYANNILKSVLAEISSHYPFIVLDNEAGLENLSRRIIQKVNLLIIVTDPSSQGIKTVYRLFDLVFEMGIKYDQLAIVVNQIHNHKLPPFIKMLKPKTNADFILELPHENQLTLLSEKGSSLLHLGLKNGIYKPLDNLLKKLSLKGKNKVCT